jgi:hypothetical protein
MYANSKFKIKLFYNKSDLLYGEIRAAVRIKHSNVRIIFLAFFSSCSSRGLICFIAFPNTYINQEERLYFVNFLQLHFSFITRTLGAQDVKYG